MDGVNRYFEIFGSKLGSFIKVMKGRSISTVSCSVVLLLLVFAYPTSALVTPITANNECPGGNAPLPCYEISGLITQQDYKYIKDIADRHLLSTNKLGTSFFRLNSEGGDIEAAIAIGQQLRRLSAMIVISADSQCSSACVFILAGATQRLIIGGKVGIHRPYSQQTKKRDYNEVQKEQRRISALAKSFLEEMNLSSMLYDAMVRVPPENIRFLSKDELEEYGLSQIDPVEEEIFNASDARKYGLSKTEFLKRKGKAKSICASKYSRGEISGQFDEYFNCTDRIMRGL